MPHTKGPWSKRQTRDGKRYIIGDGIAEVDSDDIDQYEAAANASLISAAPDLLEACRFAFEGLASDSTVTVLLARKAVADAIEKAQGTT